MRDLFRNVFVLSLVFLMISCLDEGYKTVVLPSGTVSADVIPDEIRDIVEQYITIHEGTDRPDISGFYVSDSVISVYCSDEGNGGFEPGHKFADEYLYFGPQNSSGIIHKYQSRQAKRDRTSKLVQVTGSGSEFTAFYVTESHSDEDEDGVNETWTKVSTVISGKLTSQGFTDYRSALIMVDKNDPLDRYMEVNVYRIFTEADGLVEKIGDWRSESSAMPARIPSADDAADELPFGEQMNKNLK